MKLSATLKTSLQQAVTKYHAALPGSVAARYLEEDRGLPLDLIENFRLGFVSEPQVGHEMFRGRLAIPYIRKSVEGNWSVIGIKYRVIPGVQCFRDDEKYLNAAGTKHRLYNTLDAIKNDDEISIAEGEIDALTASVYGIPCVGAPGVTSWKDHFTEIFMGYETVYALCDGDTAGTEFGEFLAGKIPNTRIIPMDRGEDVNSTVHQYGVDKILERMGKSK